MCQMLCLGTVEVVESRDSLALVESCSGGRDSLNHTNEYIVTPWGSALAREKNQRW